MLEVRVRSASQTFRSYPHHSFFKDLKQVTYFQEIDFLVGLGNQRYVAIEVKSTLSRVTREQLDLLRQLPLEIVEKWMVIPRCDLNHPGTKTVAIHDLAENLVRVL